MNVLNSHSNILDFMEAWPLSRRFGSPKLAVSLLWEKDRAHESKLVNWRGGHKLNGVK